MSDEYDETGLRDLAENVHYHNRVGLVEVARRFIREDDIGRLDYRARDGDSLLLTAREGVGISARVGSHSDGGKCRHGSCVDRVSVLFVAHSAKAERGGNVVKAGLTRA